MDVAILIRTYSKSDQQEHNRQVRELSTLAKEHKWNIVKVIVANFSGLKTRCSARDDIPELFNLVEQRAIQKILVTELTRLGNKAKDICEMYEYLNDKGISIYIHSLGHDTGAEGLFQKAINNLIVTLLTEIAEQERIKLSERIKSGMQKAKREGVVFGRPKGSTRDFALLIEKNDHYKSASWLLQRGVSLRRTANLSGISVNTVRKIKKAIADKDSFIG